MRSVGVSYQAKGRRLQGFCARKVCKKTSSILLLPSQNFYTFLVGDGTADRPNGGILVGNNAG